jgi:lipid II:glycine glycyltransferase (peptidoglycan interpeptide bridge formation enzyme)
MQLDITLPPLVPIYQQKVNAKQLAALPYKTLDVSTKTYILDLAKGKEGVWAGFEKRARNAIRKAENLGVRIRPANYTSDLTEYYRLHKDTYYRTGVNPHPIEYFEGIWKSFYARDWAYILFAEVNGQVVAAETFGLYKNAANYWTGAANEKGLACNANSLIQWHAIRHFIDIGLGFYDVGEAFPDSTSGKQRGLDLFKRSFGGELYPILRGRIVTRKILYILFKFFSMARGKA